MCHAVGFELDDDNNVEFATDNFPTDPVEYNDVPQTMKAAYRRLQGEFDYLLPLLKTLPPDLTEQEVNVACDIFLEQQNTFSKHKYDLGCTDLVEVHIPTGDAKPYAEGLCSHPKAYLDLIDKEIQAILDAEIIETAVSSLCSNIICV